MTDLYFLEAVRLEGSKFINSINSSGAHTPGTPKEREELETG